ncbi:hypothetical protein L3Y34_017105 [Caenorhabditis briggsae]|uniref:Transmembrane protein n=1 Tax=Caenorhabditis briggsae TaxID=6238 RepID=A0AAE9DI19_CAEBR|nr:hypothetical protein L3Y34_017105 [Caenorhabditis briggsae]
MKVFSSLFVVLMAVIMIGSMVSVEANPVLEPKAADYPPLPPTNIPCKSKWDCPRYHYCYYERCMNYNY